MEFLVTLAPLAVILLVCGGMHFFMMRGMHGGHAAQSGHEGHTGLGSGDSQDRVAQLEGQVARLQRELEASQSAGRSASYGYHREPVAAWLRQDDATANDAGKGYN